MRRIISLFIALGIIVTPYISNGDESSSGEPIVIAAQSLEDESNLPSSVEAILIAAQGYRERCQIDRDCSSGYICTQINDHRECRSDGGYQGHDELCEIDRDCSSGYICTQVDNSYRRCRRSP